MATSIVNPSSGSVPGMNQIDNAFSSIYSMFGSNQGSGGGNLSGGGSGNFGIKPLTNPDNSLTGLWYNLANLAGGVAGSELQAGGNLVSTGTGITQGGLDMSGTGFGTTETALNTLQPSVEFYNKLLAGDPTAMTQALAPTANALATVESGALGGASGGMPAGGYRAATMAGLPQTEAAQIGNAALNLQPQAAQALASLANEQSGIGATQAQIGQGVAGTGLGTSGVGTTLTGQGGQNLQALISAVLNKMGINYQYGGPQTFQTIASGLNQLV